MKVLFLSRSLQSGGAERQLVALATGLHRRGHEVVVAQFYSGGILENDLRNAGVPLIDLRKKGRWRNVAFLCRLWNLVHRQRPDIVHGYLGVPNLLALAGGRLATRAKVVWGVRASDMDLSRYDWLARVSCRVEARLSRFADLVIANAHSGKRHAVANGFPADKMIVIPNGVETNTFKPGRDAGTALREQWGATEAERVIGMVGRLDPMKDHDTFLKAAADVLKRYPACRFVCVGRGDESQLRRLRMLCRDLGVAQSVEWAGERNDLPAVYNAFDLLCLSSTTEGLPNVLIEAMACGVPCVATDVGDAAAVVGDTGWIVPAGRPDLLAEAMVAALGRQRPLPDPSVRERIVRNYSVENLVCATEQALSRLLKEAR